MGRTRDAICMGVGILVGITLCGPAAQAANEALTAARSTQPIYVNGAQVSMAIPTYLWYVVSLIRRRTV